jgi:hypothetical protein
LTVKPTTDERAHWAKAYYSSARAGNGAPGNRPAPRGGKRKHGNGDHHERDYDAHPALPWRHIFQKECSFDE